MGEKNPQVGKIVRWSDSEQSGYFSRDKEFKVEFPISGRNFNYGKVEYSFVDGRSSLSVQDEVLLERVHDSISNFAGKLRQKPNGFLNKINFSQLAEVFENFKGRNLLINCLK